MSLKDDLTSDLPTFLDPNEFGTAAVLNGATTINVIFDDPFEAVDPLTGEVGLTAPQAQARSSDVASAAPGQTLLVNSVTYKITGIRPDGTGFTVLILSKDDV